MQQSEEVNTEVCDAKYVIWRRVRRTILNNFRVGKRTQFRESFQHYLHLYGSQCSEG